MRIEPQQAENPTGFEIIRRLGSGGMGVVYEARSVETGARVALKTLRRLDPSSLQRLKREFRALRDFRHPNIVRVQELRQDGDLWFVTMDLIDGQDLLSWLRPNSEGGADPERVGHTVTSDPTASIELAPGTRPRRDLSQAIDIDSVFCERLREALRQLCDGLEALHGAGLIHRDIKPANIMVSGEGRLTIVDFGLVLSGPDESGNSRQALGTAAYMAPEQARGDTLTPAADWYAVGVMLYKLLAGHLPFDGTPAEMLAQKQSWLAVVPSALGGQVPAELDELCLGLLEPDRLRRFGAAQVRAFVASPDSEFVGAARPSGRFVGRSTELAALRGAVPAIGSHRAAVVAIEGESGLGKTSLLAAAHAQLVADGVTVVCGRCFDRETAAYAGVDSVIDALTNYLRDAPVEWLEHSMPRFPALLRVLFPVTASLAPVSGAPPLQAVAETRELRARAFAAYRELFQRLGQLAQIAIFIDDAQWLTAESWAFLAALVDPLAPAPVMLVLAMRPDTAATQKARQLSDPRWLIHLRLSRLDEDDSAALLEDFLTQGTSSSVLRTMLREGQGHPLFLQELARATDPRASDSDRSLDTVLHDRITTLGAEDLSVLRVVAAASTPLPRSVVAKAAGIGGNAADEAIARLQADRLVASADESPQRQVRSYHDRIRDVVLDASAGLIDGIRRRLAEALEHHAGDPAALAAAWANVGDPRRAAAHARRAAGDAMATLAFERAVHMYQLALAGTDAPEERVSLLTSLGEALASCGRSAEAAQAYMEGARTGSLAQVDELLHLGAEQLIRSGHVDEGRDVLREVFQRLGLPVLRSRGSVMRALLVRRLRLSWQRIPARFAPARAASARLLRQVDACWSQGDMLSLLDPIQGAAAHAHGLLLSLKAGDPFRVARALSVEAAFISMTPGGRPRGRRLLELANTIARGSARPELPGWLALGAGLSSMQDGGFVAARSHFECAERAFSGCIATKWEIATARQLVVWNLAYLGELRAMRARLTVGIDEAEVQENRLTDFNLRCGPSHLASLADNRAEELLAICRERLADWEKEAYPFVHHCALFARTHALLYLERGEDALALIEAAVPEIKRSQLMRSEFFRVDYLALRARTMGWLAVRNPRSALIVARAWAAHTRLRRERASWGRGMARATEAALHACEGKREQAVAALSEAAESFASSGLRLHAEAARRYLAAATGATASGYFTAEGVVAPDRLAGVLVPFPRHD